MRTARLALAALLALAPALRAAPQAAPPPARVTELLQKAAVDYREQRYMQALHAMSEVIEIDPHNPTAKNYIWVITKKIHKKTKDDMISDKEIRRGVALAAENLDRRRKRTEQIVGELRDVHARSARVRSPQDVLTGLAGLERFMGADFDEELGDVQSRAYFDGILKNLSDALRKGVFASTKDQLRAEGYLAYFRQDLPRAAALWQKALDRDPDDVKLRTDLEAMRDLIERKALEEKIEDLSKQAWIHAENGDFAEALQAWREVLKLDPENATARDQATVARVSAEKIKNDRKLKAMTRNGVELYNKGDPFGAAQIWLEVLQSDPGFEEARAWLQHASKKLRVTQPNRAAAASAAVKAPASAADSGKASDLYREGVVAYAQGQTARAIQFWRQSLQYDPRLSNAREALRQAEAELAFQ